MSGAPRNRLAVGPSAGALRESASSQDEYCSSLLSELRRRLCRLRPAADPHAIETAAEDAILTLLWKCHAYDPARGEVLPWLTVVALNRLTDLRRAAIRRVIHERPMGLELARLAVVVPPCVAAESPERWVQVRRATLLAAAKTREERGLVEARLDGGTGHACAAALGVFGLSAADRAAILTRRWELIVRRARRLWAQPRV